ncbi:hypothetical protein TSUD_352840 [Trifolium subterraneum]|nr:hypothetical protein TSUD_352840 [Trifolium subterraneum]
MADIALGTSAAPTLLPPIYFKNDGRDFNLVDGAVVASNPEYDLDESISGADNTTKENMENLVKAGENLLKQPVKVIDVNSFDPHENQNDGTNAEALERFAKNLYKEKQLRLEMKAMEKMKLMKKMGRPFLEVI